MFAYMFGCFFMYQAIEKIIMEVISDEGCTWYDGNLNPADIKFKVEVTQNNWITSCVTNWTSFVIYQTKYVIEGNRLNTCFNRTLDHYNDEIEVKIEYTNKLAAS